MGRRFLFLLWILIVIVHSVTAARVAQQPESTPFTLLGLIVAADPDKSVAVFHDTRTGEPAILSVGESLAGFALIDVQRSKVILVKDAGLYELFLNSRGPVRLHPDVPPETGASTDEGTERASNREFLPVESAPVMTFDRGEIQRRLQEEWSRIIREARLAPHTEGGRIAGFKLESIPPGSLLEEVGLRPGDIVKEINGVPLDSVAGALALYRKLQSAESIRAVVERSGKTMILRYILERPDL